MAIHVDIFNLTMHHYWIVIPFHILHNTGTMKYISYKQNFVWTWNYLKWLSYHELHDGMSLILCLQFVQSKPERYLFGIHRTSLSNFSKPCPKLLIPRPSDTRSNHMSSSIKRFITPELAVSFYIGGFRPSMVLVPCLVAEEVFLGNSKRTILIKSKWWAGALLWFSPLFIWLKSSMGTRSCIAWQNFISNVMLVTVLYSCIACQNFISNVMLVTVLYFESVEAFLCCRVDHLRQFQED